MELAERAVAPQEGTNARRCVLPGIGRDRDRKDPPPLGAAQQVEGPPDLGGDDRAGLGALRVEEGEDDDLVARGGGANEPAVVVAQSEVDELDPRRRLAAPVGARALSVRGQSARRVAVAAVRDPECRCERPRAGRSRRRPLRAATSPGCASDRLRDSLLDARARDRPGHVGDDATAAVEVVRLGHAGEAVVLVGGVAAVADGDVRRVELA